MLHAPKDRLNIIYGTCLVCQDVSNDEIVGENGTKVSLPEEHGTDGISENGYLDWRKTLL